MTSKKVSMSECWCCKEALAESRLQDWEGVWRAVPTPALNSSEKPRKQNMTREELLRHLMESCTRNNTREWAGDLDPPSLHFCVLKQWLSTWIVVGTVPALRDTALNKKNEVLDFSDWVFNKFWFYSLRALPSLFFFAGPQFPYLSVDW